MTFTVEPIGLVLSGRIDPADTDHWGTMESTIAVHARFGDQCLTGLADFSHVEVLFLFDQALERDAYRKPRRPRGRPDLPAVGVFAVRGPRRPNRIGATICQLTTVHKRELGVRGLDAIHGTPVLDIKPVMTELLPNQVHQPAWVATLMREYMLDDARESRGTAEGGS